jgi:hypothetical protein
MTLDDIYEAIATGELSQVILGNDGDGTMAIPADRRKQIRHSVQLGLTDLHTRFLIREKSFIVNRVTDKTVYLLDKRFAVSNTGSTETTKYIDDSADPFVDDLLKIDRIMDSEGKEVLLNEIDDELSVRTLADNLISVPAELETETLQIFFRANHPQINKYLADSAPMTVTLALPDKYLQALLYYIASRGLNPTGFSGERMHEGNNFAMKYEMECQRLQALGAGIESHSSNIRPIDPGWP